MVWLGRLHGVLFIKTTSLFTLAVIRTAQILQTIVVECGYKQQYSRAASIIVIIPIDDYHYDNIHEQSTNQQLAKTKR